jgi:hypothetical protein
MPSNSLSFLDVYGSTIFDGQSNWSKGIFKINLKLKIPCSKCMQQPCDWSMMSQANVCTYNMLCPIMSKADNAWALLFQSHLEYSQYTFTPAALYDLSVSFKSLSKNARPTSLVCMSL